MMKVLVGLVLWGFILSLTACSGMGGLGEAKGRDGTSFGAFYGTFRQRVAAEGLDPALLDRAFAGKPAPLAVVLERERTQPETTKTLRQYFEVTLSPTRQETGRALAAEHEAALARVSAETGVPPEVLVSLWGIESNFGRNMGDHPVIPALVTLAWRSERGAYFASEALAALRVAAREKRDPESLVGSWAGAMGQCQFMPSNYLKHARDGDGDGRVDIWGTPADVFASSGNFLKHLGWRTPPGGASLWRVKARVTVPLPEAAGFNERGLSKPHSIGQWQRWGVVPQGQAFGSLGGLETATRVYRPLGNSGPTYMLSPNFEVILGWNKSSYFAASVLLLADAIRDGELPDV